jgi:hypothetical protein
MSVTRAVIWLCYQSEEKAKEAFSKLKNTALAGPGEIQLRFNPNVPLGWWVVLYDVVWVASPYKIAEVLEIPSRQSEDSWFEYEGAPKIRNNIENSQLKDRFIVEASEEKLQAFKKMIEDNDLARDPYACPHQSDIVRTGEEVNRRIKLLQEKGSLKYEPLSLYK